MVKREERREKARKGKGEKRDGTCMYFGWV